MDRVTGYAALPVLRECDRLIVAGRWEERNALLLTVDPAMWYGREIVTAAMMGAK